MSLWTEAREGIAGALQLARRDTSGLSRFNFSVEGFWRSFFAAVILIPIEIFQISFFGTVEFSVGTFHRWIVEIIAYVLAWTAWPLIVHFLTQRTGHNTRFVEYVVVFNWAQVPVNIFFAFMLVIGALTGGPGLIWLGAIIAIMVYLWYIAWTVLECGRGFAAALQFLYLLTLYAVRGFAALAMGMSTPGA